MAYISLRGFSIGTGTARSALITDYLDHHFSITIGSNNPSSVRRFSSSVFLTGFNRFFTFSSDLRMDLLAIYFLWKFSLYAFDWLRVITCFHSCGAWVKVFSVSPGKWGKFFFCYSGSFRAGISMKERSPCDFAHTSYFFHVNPCTSIR